MIKNLHRYVVIFLFIAVMAGTWDVWWHGSIGRDTLFEPPHLLLYSSVVLAILSGVYGYIKTKDKHWKWLAILLVLVPISAPFDELWHRTFGIEDISTIWAVWSPPHVALALAIIGSLAMLFPIIKKEKDVAAKRIFGSMILASILSLLLFLASPIQPTGPWAILGFWGVGIVALLIVGIMLIANRYVHGIASATLMAIFFIVISAIGFSETIAEGVVIVSHDHAPAWLTIFSLLVPAVMIDITKKSPLWLKGALAGLLWSGLLYGFSSMFFEPQFQYSLVEGSIAIISSAVGGLLAGLIIKRQ